MADDLDVTDEISEIVSEVERSAQADIAAQAEERRPWLYFGWAVFSQDDGKPIAIRPEDVVAIRPADGHRCGLTLRGRDKTSSCGASS